MCSTTLMSHKRQKRTVTVFGSCCGTGIQPDLEVTVNLETIERIWPSKVVFYMIVVKIISYKTFNRLINKHV